MPDLAEQLCRHEGFVGSAYQDSRGYWTIGYGRLIDKRLGGRISEVEARYLLHNDIAQCRQEIQSRWPWSMSLPRPAQDVLCNMCFNLGASRLSRFPKFLAALENRNYSIAADEMLNSAWAQQVSGRAVELAGIIRGLGT